MLPSEFRADYQSFDRIGSALREQPDLQPEFDTLNTIDKILKGTFLRQFPELIKDSRRLAAAASDPECDLGSVISGGSTLIHEQIQKRYDELLEQGIARANTFMQQNPGALVCWSAVLPLRKNTRYLGRVERVAPYPGLPEVAMFSTWDERLQPREKNQLGFDIDHLNDEAQVALRAAITQTNLPIPTGVAL